MGGYAFTMQLSGCPASPQSDPGTTNHIAQTNCGSQRFSGYNDLNPFLLPSDVAGLPSGAACDQRDGGTICLDFPGVFSGLYPSPRSTPNELRLIGITDRGPNRVRHSMGSYK